MLISVLENYPFQNIGVRVGAGFTESAGVDYVLDKNGEYASFQVYNMYEGDFRFGVSEEWGKYFVVSKQVGEWRFDCVYANLDHVNVDLQKYAIIQGTMDFVVPAKFFLGWTSGGRDQRQLHIELHQKKLQTGERKKLDPYGIYDRASSGKYPRPGNSLVGLDHCWTNDNPEFIKI